MIWMPSEVVDIKAYAEEIESLRFQRDSYIEQIRHLTNICQFRGKENDELRKEVKLLKKAVLKIARKMSAQ